MRELILRRIKAINVEVLKIQNKGYFYESVIACGDKWEIITFGKWNRKVRNIWNTQTVLDLLTEYEEILGISE